MRMEFGSRARAAVRRVAAALAGGLLAVSVAQPAVAAPKGVDPAKYAAIVVDTATGRVLYDANPDSRRYPASLTKMMTLYVLFEDLERGRFRLDTPLKVSALASKQAPSKLGLRAGSTIAVEDAIKALVTKSANDASVVIAENVAGSVPAFADRMTRTARAIGMTNSRFRNPNGLPDAGQYTTARDMMKLGVALQVRFPRYYGYFSTRAFAYRGRTHGNHNNLLGRIEGVDGIKTGYINASGFNLVSSVKRDGRRIVAVVMGGRSARSRDAHMVALINAFLPKASRGGGFDGELVASIRNAPRVAASAPQPVPAALADDPAAAPVALAAVVHPRPPARPLDALPVVEEGSADPALAPVPVAVASAEPAPAPVPLSRAVATTTIPVPVAAPEPIVLANSDLPSSAAEAFADVAPAPNEGQDILGQMIVSKIGDRTVRVAAVETPVVHTASVVADSVPVAEAPAPVRDPEPVRTRRANASGWLIQIGAVGSESAANALLEKAQAKAGRALAKADPVTESFAKGGQTYVRARFAGFGSEKEAQKACALLKRNAFNCYAIRL